MRVLVACEYSGRVREAFRRLGHDATSCDLLPAEDSSPHHHKGDVSEMLKQPWDLVIAHPPCTRLCNSGVRWLDKPPSNPPASCTPDEAETWPRLSADQRLDLIRQHMEDGAAFFLECLNANAPRVAVENPVMHKYAREIIGRGHDFSVQPWQFGDPAKKRTCFWTRGLPPLRPTSSMTSADARADCHLASPGPDRWKERSRTYQGIADAIAAQWGEADLLTVMEAAE